MSMPKKEVYARDTRLVTFCLSGGTMTLGITTLSINTFSKMKLSTMTFSKMTFSKISLGKKGLFSILSMMAFSINDTQHNTTSAIVLSIIMLNVAFYLLLC